MGADAGPPHILAGFAESLAAPECVWSLRDAGFRVTAFTRNGSRPALRLSKGQALVAVPSPSDDAEETVRAIVAAAEHEHVAGLMPLDDAAVWLADRAAASMGAQVIGPTGHQARFALDKEMQVAAASAAGFEVPASHFAAASELRPANVPFPSYVRPAAAVECVDGRLVRRFGGMCADAAELERVIAPLGSSRVLVQPRIRGVSHGLFGLFWDGELLAAHAHQRVRMVAPEGSGSSACQPVEVPSAMLEPLQSLLTAIEWRGMFMVELLREPEHDSWRFIEFNGRAWGSMALARDLGADYPAWAATKTLVEPGFSPPPLVFDGSPFVCRHLGRDIVHLLTVLRGNHSRAAVDWPSRRKTLKAVLTIRRSDTWYNARRGEARVFFDDAFRTVFDFVRGFLRRRLA